jgi:GNAT superfamily N-acetyltransferase
MNQASVALDPPFSEHAVMKHVSAEITIREASVSDSAEVAEVFNAAFTPLRSIYRPTDEAAACQTERIAEGTRIVAEFSRRIVGTVQFVNHKKNVHLIGLAVHPEFQRKGVARYLIEWIVARTPSLGQKVALNTIRETGNVPVFERLGFQVVDEEIASWCISDDYLEVHDVKMERITA